VPELPEVETTRRGLAPHLDGRRIRRVIVREPRLRRRIPASLPGRLGGARITGLHRRAKYLLLETDRGTALIHLGMSGSLRVAPPGSAPARHEHYDLVLDDGRIVLWVDQVTEHEVVGRVVVGGELTNRKGINRQGGGLSAPALTEKDREDIKVAARIQADYLAVSFPRCAEDINEARELLRAAGGHGEIVAKIERAEALDVLDEILAATDVIMIARGDLGVEIGDAALPPVQKSLIHKARAMNRVVITATQMMESMIENQIPTRAEVFDVANAVLDGTDAVMLSAETAMGRYPDKAIDAMDRICREAEKQRTVTVSDHRIHSEFTYVDEAVAMASMYVANHLGVKAIAALTESGSTPLWMSRISSAIPIYALTRHVETRRRVTLYRGVYPVSFDVESQDHAEVNREAVDELLRRGAVRDGDLVILTKGDLMGVHGGTNALKIVKVGELV